jgi:hypothetical protein
MKRLSRLIELCACALYLMALMVPLPVWWMATMLDEHGIDLPELPVIAVALALSFGVFVLARKTEDMAMECRTAARPNRGSRPHRRVLQAAASSRR